jgi:hypothetical protein
MNRTQLLLFILIAPLCFGQSCRKEEDPGVNSPCDSEYFNYEWVNGECVCPPPFQEVFGDCKQLQTGFGYEEFVVQPIECICDATEKGIVNLSIGATVTLPTNPDPPNHVPIDLDISHPEIQIFPGHIGTLYYETEIGTLSPGDSISTRFGINTNFSCTPLSWPDDEDTRNGFFLCHVTHPDTIQATYFFERRISELEYVPDTCRFLFYR